MRKFICAVAMLVFSSSIALAQTAPGPGGQVQEAKPAGPPMRPMGLGNPHGFVDKLKTELKLDDAQYTALQNIVKEHDKTMQELRTAMRQSPEVMKQMNELRDKMKAAGDANDQAASKAASDEMQRLRTEQMKKIAPTREKMTQEQQGLKDKLRGVLPASQHGSFDKLWEENMGSSIGNRGRTNPRMVRAMMERLPDLSADQKRQMVDLFKQFDESMRTQKDMTPDQRETENKKLTDSLMGLLTAEQKARVEERLAGRGDMSGARPERPKAEGLSNPNQPPEPKP